MSAPDPIITIGAEEYRLSDFPEEHREYLEFDMIDDEEEQAEDFELSGLKPADCIQSLHHEWQKSIAIVNGMPSQAYELGNVYRGIIGFYPDGDFAVNNERSEDDCAPDEKFNWRLRWLEGEQGYVVWVRRDDTGDGIMLDNTVYMVAFTDKALETRFLAAFPEVAR